MKKMVVQGTVAVGRYRQCRRAAVRQRFCLIEMGNFPSRMGKSFPSIRIGIDIELSSRNWTYSIRGWNTAHKT